MFEEGLTKAICALIQDYCIKHPDAAIYGGEIVTQNDMAYDDAVRLVCAIMDEFSERYVPDWPEENE